MTSLGTKCEQMRDKSVFFRNTVQLLQNPGFFPQGSYFLCIHRPTMYSPTEDTRLHYHIRRYSKCTTSSATVASTSKTVAPRVTTKGRLALVRALILNLQGLPLPTCRFYVGHTRAGAIDNNCMSNEPCDKDPKRVQVLFRNTVCSRVKTAKSPPRHRRGRVSPTR